MFRNNYFFLSNMYECKIRMDIDGKSYTFNCVEAAFQAHKEPAKAHLFEGINGYEAKKLGRKVNLPADWNTKRIDIMRRCLNLKFAQNPLLYSKLMHTTEDIVEENTWNDTFWGVCNGKGKNMLGKLLMEIRDRNA